MKGVIDPIQFVSLVWPSVTLYDRQREILYSVRDNDETIVPAGNGLGKDFVSAICALWFFCSRRPARVVTTSVKHDQLNDVLWGEIRRLLNIAQVNLPIQYNHLKIRQTYRDGSFVPLCELVGQVANKGEALLGRHLPKDIPRTLVIFDEASGIDDANFKAVDTWCHRKLIIGNPFPTTNYFYQGVEQGDIPRPNGDGYYRKVIRIKAENSPNVQYGQARERAGADPNATLIPGLVDYPTYQKRRQLWDSVMQCIGLDAEFWKGRETLMFPPEWLNAAERVAAQLLTGNRKGKAIGVDPAEGGDKTAMACVDEYGLLELVSEKTSDTSVIRGKVRAFAQKWGVEPENVLFDTGGGGKQIADVLREDGFRCETIGFGETVTPDKIRGIRTIKEHKLAGEDRYTYVNRRAQMYSLLRQLLDPLEGGFGLPQEYAELRRQLALIPLTYDGEGRIYLLPKHKKPNSTQKCLHDLIGCSPDEADAVVLATYRLLHKPRRIIVG